MLKLSWLTALLILAVGCATSGPRNMSEAFPARNQDPRVGIVVNNGTAHLNLFVYDEAGRLVEETYLAGANRWLTIDGQRLSQDWARLLEPGNYRLEVWPFYYRNQIFPPARYRVDLPKQTTSVWVDRNPSQVWYKGRHWGWILYLNGGEVPDTAHGLPGVKVNLGGGLGLLGDIFQ